MAKPARKTVSRGEYDAVAREANIAQELSWALLRGEKPRRFVAGGWAVWTIATHRAHGGLACVVEKSARKRDLCSWTYLDEVAAGSACAVDPYIRCAVVAALSARQT